MIIEEVQRVEESNFIVCLQDEEQDIKAIKIYAMMNLHKVAFYCCPSAKVQSSVNFLQ